MLPLVVPPTFNALIDPVADGPPVVIVVVPPPLLTTVGVTTGAEKASSSLRETKLPVAGGSGSIGMIGPMIGPITIGSVMMGNEPTGGFAELPPPLSTSSPPTAVRERARTTAAIPEGRSRDGPLKIEGNIFIE
jgi:hypothetical protein